MRTLSRLSRAHSIEGTFGRDLGSQKFQDGVKGLLTQLHEAEERVALTNAYTDFAKAVGADWPALE